MLNIAIVLFIGLSPLLQAGQFTQGVASPSSLHAQGVASPSSLHETQVPIFPSELQVSQPTSTWLKCFLNFQNSFFIVVQDSSSSRFAHLLSICIQVFLGHPLSHPGVSRQPSLLFPLVFQVRYCLLELHAGLLRVWAIYSQHLWRMSSSTGCCFALLHNFLLEILSGQLHLIFLRQGLIKTCLFFMVVTVVLQVSAP